MEQLLKLNHCAESSTLDSDDIVGPGLCFFPRHSGNLSKDYGLFLLAVYSGSKHYTDRLNFAKNITSVHSYLGGLPTPILLKYVSNKQTGGRCHSYQITHCLPITEPRKRTLVKRSHLPSNRYSPFGKPARINHLRLPLPH